MQASILVSHFWFGARPRDYVTQHPSVHHLLETPYVQCWSVLPFVTSRPRSFHPTQWMMKLFNQCPWLCTTFLGSFFNNTHMLCIRADFEISNLIIQCQGRFLTKKLSPKEKIFIPCGLLTNCPPTPSKFQVSKVAKRNRAKIGECSQNLKSDTWKVLMFKDSRTYEDKTWKNIGWFLVFIKAILE